MVLIISDGCSFCDKFKDVKGLVIAKLVRVGEEIKMEVGGINMEVPGALEGVPALIDGRYHYIGQGPIEERLKHEIYRSSVSTLGFNGKSR